MNQANTPSPSPDHHWILVVDDEAAMGDLLTEVLSLEGLRVVAARDGATALQLLAQAEIEPLLVLTDVLMPGMDGLTLARKLQPQLKRGKIALMSGHLSDSSWWPADLRECAFLAKPFQLTELQALIHEARLEYGQDR